MTDEGYCSINQSEKFQSCADGMENDDSDALSIVTDGSVSMLPEQTKEGLGSIFAKELFSDLDISAE